MPPRSHVYDKGVEPVPGYRLTDYLGGGTFGEVWKTMDVATGRHFALKIIDLSYSSSALKELRALKLVMDLNHPNLVPITKAWLKDKHGQSLDLHTVDLVRQKGKLSQLLILMGLGERSLSARLKEVNRTSDNAADDEEPATVGIPPAELLNYMLGAAKGIDYLNAARHKGVDPAVDGPIIHCDIKPDNMMIVAGTEVQIADCGVAILLNQDSRKTVSVAFSAVYAPPELSANKPNTGTDQYSLAISYYELRTGRRPFADGMSPLEMMTTHALGDLDLSSPILTPGERRALEWASARRVSDRYRTCVDMVKQLERGIEGLPVLAPGELRKPGSSNPAASPRATPGPGAPAPDGTRTHSVDLFTSSVGGATGANEGESPGPDPELREIIRGSQGVPSPTGRTPNVEPAPRPTAPAKGPGWLGSLGGAVAAGLGLAADALRGRNHADVAPGAARRHTDVSFPARVPVGKVHLLRVAVVPAEETLPGGEVRARPKPHAHDVTMLLEVPDGSPTRLRVSVTAENFAIDGPTRAELVVPVGGASAAVTFELRGLAVGPGRVMVDFAQYGRPVGSVDLLPEVSTAGESAADSSAPASDYSNFTRPVAWPAPDVVLKVFVHRFAGGPGRLQFVVSSADPRLADLAVLDGDFGTQDLHADLGEWVAGHLRTLSELAASDAADQVPAALAGIGASLYDQLLPPALKDLCWVLRERGVRSVLVLSDDPHVPWELLKPFRTDPVTGELQEDDFWGATYALTHWLRGRPPVARLSLRRVVAMAAGGFAPPPRGAGTVTRDIVAVGQLDWQVVTDTHLPSAAAELNLMRSLGSASVAVECAPALRRRLRDLFEASEFTALHVASHGTFAAAAADASAVHLEDGAFRAAEVSPQMAAGLRRRGPLVFFNACHSGRVGFGLTQLGSWGARLTQAGCGAFVGSLWSVTDAAALAFAGHFYRLLGDGLPIGEAVRQARLAVRAEYPGDPTWLAYRCFADPAARLAPAGRPNPRP